MVVLLQSQSQQRPEAVQPAQDEPDVKGIHMSRSAPLAVLMMISVEPLQRQIAQLTQTKMELEQRVEQVASPVFPVHILTLLELRY